MQRSWMQGRGSNVGRASVPAAGFTSQLAAGKASPAVAEFTSQLAASSENNRHSLRDGLMCWLAGLCLPGEVRAQWQRS